MPKNLKGCYFKLYSGLDKFYGYAILISSVWKKHGENLKMACIKHLSVIFL